MVPLEAVVEVVDRVVSSVIVLRDEGFAGVGLLRIGFICNGQILVGLTLVTGDILARDALELDYGLDQTGVAEEHHLVILVSEVVLHVVADFVQNLGTHVAARPLDTVHLHFHVLKVPLLHARLQLLHARVERHHLQPAQHNVVQVHIAGQGHEWRHLVQRHKLLRVYNLILVLRNFLLVWVIFRHYQLI